MPEPDEKSSMTRAIPACASEGRYFNCHETNLIQLSDKGRFVSTCRNELSMGVAAAERKCRID